MLDVVVRESVALLELVVFEDQALLVRRDALQLLDPVLDDPDLEVGLDIHGDRLACGCLHEDLHGVAVGVVASDRHVARVVAVLVVVLVVVAVLVGVVVVGVFIALVVGVFIALVVGVVVALVGVATLVVGVVTLVVGVVALALALVDVRVDLIT